VFYAITAREKSLTNNARFTGMRALAEAFPNQNPVEALDADLPGLARMENEPKLKFLAQLYGIKCTYIYKFGKSSKNVTDSTFHEIQTQYAHLKAVPIPGTDFSTEKEREEYFAVVDCWLAQIVEIYKAQKKHKEFYAAVKKIVTEDLWREKLPSFAEEIGDHVWQQFLDKDAPGWPTDGTSAPGVTLKQRIPNGGIRIVEQWEKDVADVIGFLDANREDGTSRFQSGLAEAQKTVAHSSDGRDTKTFNLVCSLNDLPTVLIRNRV
jgi:hypothetical protein